MNQGKYDIDPYTVLGVNRDANKKQIKRAYRKLALKYHPDKHALKSKTEKRQMEEMFKSVKEAYSIVSDPVERKRWERFHRDSAMRHTQTNQPTQPTPHPANFDPLASIFEIPGDMTHCEEKTEAEFKTHYFTEANANLRDFLKSDSNAISKSTASQKTYTHRAASTEEIQKLIRSMRPDKGPLPGIATPDAPCTSGCTMFNSVRRNVPSAGRPDARMRFVSKTIPGAANKITGKAYQTLANQSRLNARNTDNNTPSAQRPKPSVSRGTESESSSGAPTESRREKVDEVKAVVIEGLKKAHYHNGSIAIVLGRQEKTGRVRVKLANSNQVFAIKPENGRPVPVATLMNLRSRASLNGTYVVMDGKSKDGTRRYVCRLINSQEYDRNTQPSSDSVRKKKTFLVHGKNLRLEPGTRARKENWSKGNHTRNPNENRPKGAAIPDWSDERIEIIRYMPENGKYVVRSESAILPIRSFRLFNPSCTSSNSTKNGVQMASSVFEVYPNEISVDFKYYV